MAVTSGVAGTAAVYSLASDVQEPIAFHYTNSGSYYVLCKIDSDQEWLTKIWNPNTAIGLPIWYRETYPNASTAYKQIEIFPIANTSITLNYEYYKTKGTDLTSSTTDLATEIPNIPDYCHDAVWKGGLYRFLKGFDDPAQIKAQEDYERAKLAMDVADEKDLDTDLRWRWDRSNGSIPHGTQFKR